ncbi:WecB/TagA/CpsF family glycosyltransferase [Patescibacteria group bacterium]|nr:WecB/TagA/CpsF family glycosyltransferase [Patescibacteria group bacterium]
MKSKKVDILGVKIDPVTKEDTTSKASSFLTQKEKVVIYTPNPEICLKAARNFEYKEVLNKADISIPDGVGLQWAASYLERGFALKKSKYLNILLAGLSLGASVIKFVIWPKYKTLVLPERVTGVDTFLKFTEMCEQKDCSIYLLGAKPGVARRVADNLQKKYPKLRISGSYSGSPNPEDDKKLRYIINDSGAKILFVAYGAPKQEFWIDRNLPYLKNVKLVMGVGGTFDFISGKAKRAPKKYHSKLEWFWRLRKEPWRKKRIYNAVIRFPYMVYLDKIYRNRPYRENVLAVILNTKGQFLLLNNSYITKHEKHADHWQFLQGGKRSYESSKTAVLREAKEEMGSSKLQPILELKKAYRYEWPLRDINPARPFRGQLQSIWFLKYVGDGSDIKIDPKEHSDYRWVNKDALLKTLHPHRHGSAKIILKTLEKKNIFSS